MGCRHRRRPHRQCRCEQCERPYYEHVPHWNEMKKRRREREREKERKREKGKERERGKKREREREQSDVC